MGILQHHDAVAGTAKQKVTSNYFTTGAKAQTKFNKLYAQVLKEQTEIDIGEKPTGDIIFTQWNNTYLQDGVYQSLSANKSVILGIFNPGPAGVYPIRVHIDERDVNVHSVSNSLIAGDVLCTNSSKDSKDCELLFHLALNASVLNYVKIEPAKTGSGSAKAIKLKEMGLLETTKSWNVTSSIHLNLTKSTEKFTLSNNGTIFQWSLGYNYYESYQGTGQKSGAYIFRPSAATINAPKKYSTIKNIYYAEGNSTLVVVLEGDKTYSRLYFHRLDNFDYGFELHTYVNSISIDDKQGK